MVKGREDRLLIVEDDPDFAEVTKMHLEKRGKFEIDIETDSTAVVSRIATHDYDCIISDYDMPQMNGLELLETIREDRPKLPFILFTGRGSEDVASRAISANVTDYLQKSGSSDTFELLANRVKNAIEWFRAEDELRREKQLSERIVRVLPNGLVVHDQKGDAILLNERASEILGTTEAELDADKYDSSSWELHDAAGNPVSNERLPFRRVAAGENLREEPYTVHTSDGEAKRIVVSGARLCNDVGEVEAVIIHFRVVDQE